MGFSNNIKVYMLNSIVNCCTVSFVKIRSSMDPLDVLPKELMEKIFSYLSALELAVVSRVSSKWRERSNIDPLWYVHILFFHKQLYGYI